MNAFALTLLAYYIAVIAVFCVYGLHRYWLLWLFLRTGGLKGNGDAGAPRRFETLPRVTVQLPMFNERHVAERVIRAACGIEYPADRLQIQVLDDSTDVTAEIARRCCESMAATGLDIQYLHRSDRSGYKAGALAEGMKLATGEFIALFDADFVPPSSVLRDSIHHFTDERIGMVQMRWGHLNRDDSLLTQIQALCLDGHFVIEQIARSRTGRWFNFNGTAGIWRRAAIDDAGGWEHDTLTEDTDLSYRAQLKGWRFKFLPHVVCPAELPPSIGALRSQQHRWNKGLIQTAIKLLPTIMRSRTPLRARIEAFFHLTSPVPYAAIFVLSLLVLPALFINLPSTGISPQVALGLGVLCLGLGTFAACAFYLVAEWAQGRRLWSMLWKLPVLMAIGIGVSALNTLAIVEAILGRRSPFVRTPKYNGAQRSDPDPAIARRRFHPLPGTIEMLLGGVMLVSLVLAATQPFTLIGVPFIVLFAAGYLMVGLPRLLGSMRHAPGRERRSSNAEVAAAEPAS